MPCNIYTCVLCSHGESHKLLFEITWVTSLYLFESIVDYVSVMFCKGLRVTETDIDRFYCYIPCLWLCSIASINLIILLKCMYWYALIRLSGVVMCLFVIYMLYDYVYVTIDLSIPAVSLMLALIGSAVLVVEFSVELLGVHLLLLDDYTCCAGTTQWEKYK